MEDIIADFVPVFTALSGIIRTLLLPTGGQDAVSMMFWFYVVLGMVLSILALYKSFGGGSKKKA